LIVEDEIRLARALAQIMKEQKYAVDMGNNGSNGFDYTPRQVSCQRQAAQR